MDSKITQKSSSNRASTPIKTPERRRISVDQLSPVQTVLKPAATTSPLTNPHGSYEDDLACIIRLYETFKSKEYMKGGLYRLHELTSDGQFSKNREWALFDATVRGTELILLRNTSIDDEDDINTNGSDDDIPIQAQKQNQSPQQQSQHRESINFADGTVDWVGVFQKLISNTMVKYGIISLNSAGSNQFFLKPLLSQSADTAQIVFTLKQWACAIRLALFEEMILGQLYTETLFRRPDYMELEKKCISEDAYHRANSRMEGWLRLRISGQTKWKDYYCICERQYTDEQIMNGKVNSKKNRVIPGGKGHLLVFESKKDAEKYIKQQQGSHRNIKKAMKHVFLKMRDVDAVRAIYPEKQEIINYSTIFKLHEGALTLGDKAPRNLFKSITSSIKWGQNLDPAVANKQAMVEKNCPTFILCMAKTQEEMMRWILGLWCTFDLNGRGLVSESGDLEIMRNYMRPDSDILLNVGEMTNLDMRPRSTSAYTKIFTRASLQKINMVVTMVNQQNNNMRVPPPQQSQQNQHRRTSSFSSFHNRSSSLSSSSSSASPTHSSPILPPHNPSGLPMQTATLGHPITSRGSHAPVRAMRSLSIDDKVSKMLEEETSSSETESSDSESEISVQTDAESLAASTVLNIPVIIDSSTTTVSSSSSSEPTSSDKSRTSLLEFMESALDKVEKKIENGEEDEESAISFGSYEDESELMSKVVKKVSASKAKSKKEKFEEKRKLKQKLAAPPKLSRKTLVVPEEEEEEVIEDKNESEGEAVSSPKSSSPRSTTGKKTKSHRRRLSKTGSVIAEQRKELAKLKSALRQERELLQYQMESWETFRSQAQTNLYQASELASGSIVSHHQHPYSQSSVGMPPSQYSTHITSQYNNNSPPQFSSIHQRPPQQPYSSSVVGMQPTPGPMHMHYSNSQVGMTQHHPHNIMYQQQQGGAYHIPEYRRNGSPTPSESLSVRGGMESGHMMYGGAGRMQIPLGDAFAEEYHEEDDAGNGNGGGLINLVAENAKSKSASYNPKLGILQPYNGASGSKGKQNIRAQAMMNARGRMAGPPAVAGPVRLSHAPAPGSYGEMYPQQYQNSPPQQYAHPHQHPYPPQHQQHQQQQQYPYNHQYPQSQHRYNQYYGGQ